MNLTARRTLGTTSGVPLQVRFLCSASFFLRKMYEKENELKSVNLTARRSIACSEETIFC